MTSVQVRFLCARERARRPLFILKLQKNLIKWILNSYSLACYAGGKPTEVKLPSAAPREKLGVGAGKG
jgi:hypothetical protein